MKKYSIENYQHFAMRTATEKCRDFSNAALGLTGEAGEVAEIIKKWLYHEHELNKAALKKELGDLLWYVTLMCELLGTTLDEIADINIKKLFKRYPDGFSSEASRNRDV